ncbi:hypothetical protein J6590_047216 [Homalodisca vitripennis]|nr:hypothetical protein J6590_047216 [Homalodisca vitripennis]
MDRFVLSFDSRNLHHHMLTIKAFHFYSLQCGVPYVTAPPRPRLHTRGTFIQFEDFSCARDLECVVMGGRGGGVALCAASRKHFL